MIKIKIGLHDADTEHLKNKVFPNYALMKISAYHKYLNNEVEWWLPAKNYDIVYSSKIFDFTPENLYLPSNTIKGGTGYDVNSKLPEQIETMFPDYSIYPRCNYAIGYITRGCPNSCKWCIVPEKEGNIRPYRKWEQLIRTDSNKLVLMDNNILACDYGISQLESLGRSNIYIDLNQGMDARLVTDNIAKILFSIKWIKYIRFSCDQKSQIDSIFEVYEILKKYGIGTYRIFVYLLVSKDLNDAAIRVEALKKLKGISLYAQAERNESLNIVPNRLQLEFACRYIYGRCYKKESWEQYLERHKFDKRLKNVAI